MASRYIVYNLRETYHEYGVYDVKIVLDPKYFKNAQMSDVKFTDSDGNEMKFTVEKWGRKINCKFIIDRNVSDGVSVIDMKLVDENGKIVTGRSTFWVIKP